MSLRSYDVRFTWRETTCGLQYCPRVSVLVYPPIIFLLTKYLTFALFAVLLENRRTNICVDVFLGPGIFSVICRFACTNIWISRLLLSAVIFEKPSSRGKPLKGGKFG